MDYIINSCIEKISKAREKAKSDLDKDFILCNNAIYGKTLLNQMKQMDVKITPAIHPSCPLYLFLSSNKLN